MSRLRTYRPLGTRTQRNALDRLREAAEREVYRRSSGYCEFPGCTRWGTDLAHGFRRGNRIGSPLCEHPALLFRACRDHHDMYDGRRSPKPGEEWRCRRLERTMAGRAEAVFGRVRRPGDLPIDSLRRLERRLRASGGMDEIWELAA